MTRKKRAPKKKAKPAVRQARKPRARKPAPAPAAAMASEPPAEAPVEGDILPGQGGVEGMN